MIKINKRNMFLLKRIFFAFNLFFVSLFLYFFAFEIFKKLKTHYFYDIYEEWVVYLCDYINSSLFPYLFLIGLFFLLLIINFLSKNFKVFFSKKIKSIELKNLFLIFFANLFVFYYLYDSNSLLVFSFLGLFFNFILFILKKIDIKKIRYLSFILFVLMFYECLNISFKIPYIMNEWVEVEETSCIYDDCFKDKEYLKNIDKDFVCQKYLDYYGITYNNMYCSLSKVFSDNKFISAFRGEKKIFDLFKFYKNIFLEYHHRNINRGQIDHFSYILLPANEINLGKDIKKIYFQYGIGTTFLFKKIMDIFGGISINNYYKNYLWYLLYYIVSILIFRFIFKKSFYFYYCLFSLLIMFYFNNYVAFVLGPGLIPIIHFFDIINLFFIYKFVTKNENKYKWILFFTSIVSIVLNLNWGIFIAISVFSVLFLYEFYIKRINYYFYLFALFICFICYFFVGKLSYNLNIFYLILGFFSWKVPFNMVFVVILYIFLNLILIFCLFEENPNPYKYLYLYSFIYSLFTLIYYFWNGFINHFYMPIFFILITIIFAVYVFIDKTKQKNIFLNFYFNILKLGLIYFIFCFLLFLIFKFYFGNFGKYKYLSIFKTHVTYKWNIKNAKIITTMSENYFVDSINLIYKYIEIDKRIVVLSKYDIFLPLLVEKYYPYNNFAISPLLFSKEIINNIENEIVKNKPKYIFVDNEFAFASFDDPYDILYDDFFNNKERKSRELRYNLIKGIFQKIKSNYVFVEQGKLISVFQIIDK